MKNTIKFSLQIQNIFHFSDREKRKFSKRKQKFQRLYYRSSSFFIFGVLQIRRREKCGILTERILKIQFFQTEKFMFSTLVIGNE